MNDYLNKIIQGDCLEVMKNIPDNSVDSIVTDPPYGLEFMGKEWDKGVPGIHFWQEMLRVLKPGGHLLSFGGSRTYHRMAVAIEDAGFEIRDQIMWVYGSGFPKSLNIGKVVDKLQGNEREVVGKGKPHVSGEGKNNSWESGYKLDYNTTKGTSEWEGWGTALKPAHEPIVVARKPLSEKSVAENVLKWGTGGINIDGCRVGAEILPEQKAGQAKIGTFERKNMITPEREGRFPANFIHDGSDEVVERFPNSKSTGGSGEKSKGKMGNLNWEGQATGGFGDSGSAARFFYVAKASKAERDKSNNHPTVKPIKLMRYLCRLVTPKEGIVLDPFLGSGTTAIAARLEGFKYIGIEKEKDYIKIAEDRLRQEVLL